ncbi:unnamed protein product [Pleuronectes platessa]|uniref:Uncharacterized protein n=1 Tax=Pleuronectes platessa TaxID=8262 RepID=A0A9N7W2Z7_PLEPL|nr:unnamed protein product [Pleuronectes platessa]
MSLWSRVSVVITCLCGHVSLWSRVSVVITCLRGHVSPWSRVSVVITCLCGHVSLWSRVSVVTCLRGHVSPWSSHVSVVTCLLRSDQFHPSLCFTLFDNSLFSSLAPNGGAPFSDQRVAWGRGRTSPPHHRTSSQLVGVPVAEAVCGGRPGSSVFTRW